MRHCAPVLVALALAACRPPAPKPPRAEFLVSSGDSTFWVRSGPDGIRARGSPLRLARYGGRFYELYLVDDDHSFTDALIVGQQLYRRSILRGDSALVFDDTAIGGIARWYARTHSSDRPLDDDEDAPDDPHVNAQSDFQILAQDGPYVSYEYRADLTVSGSEDWHTVRRGVVDLRDGKGQSVADIFGERNATYVLRKGRSLFTQTVDSVLASRDTRALKAASTLGDFTFDATSFTIASVDRDPTIVFVAPGHGTRAGGLMLPLPPVRVATPTWWAESQAGLPSLRGDTAGDRWTHGRYTVAAHPDGTADGTRLTIIDTLGRSWPVASLPAAPSRIYWLDGPSVDSTTRHALERAFDEAALYSDETRTAALPMHRGAERRASLASLRAPFTPPTHRHHAWRAKHHANPRRSLPT